MKTVQQLLQERGERYGDFADVAATTEALMDVMHQGASWNTMPPTHKCALYMIANKIARAVNGDAMYDDNFKDIAGYAQLVVEQLEK